MIHGTSLDMYTHKETSFDQIDQIRPTNHSNALNNVIFVVL